jgi:hypothetical protein
MSSTYNCAQVVDIADEPHHHLVIANQYIRAFAVDVPAHIRTLCHRHPNEYFIYVATGAEIVSAARDEEPKRLKYVDGECELSKAGLEHIVENLGDGPFRNVVVEISGNGASLKRGMSPVAMKGDVKMDDLVAKAPGAVFRLKLEPGAEAEIAGPAVVSSPHGDEVMVRELDEFDIPLNSFGKPMWVCAPRKIGIRNAGLRVAGVVVFQIGKVRAS